MENNTVQPEENPIKTDQTVSDEQKKWIWETSLQSWEPELLISGVAIYLTINLPGFLDWLFDYYVYNYLLDLESVEYRTVILVYGMIISISYLLIITFIAHFAVRALWVGMIGLLSVFPEGINFSKISFYGEYYKAQMRDKLKSLETFIVELDKQCSVLFSVSFLFVLLFLGVSWMYLVIYLFISTFRFFMTSEQFKDYEFTIYSSLIFILLTYAIIISLFNLKQFRDNPRISKWHFLANWNFNKIAFPLVFYPMSYIIMTFFSNISVRKLTFYGVLTFIAVYASLMYSMLNKEVRHIFESRSFYSQRTEENLLNAQNYDNLRDFSEPITRISIQADVIKEPFIKVFLAYPKRLDQKLRDFCKDIQPADSLNKYEKRYLLDKKHLDCIGHYYQLYIDDSLYQKQEFVYFENENLSKKGFLTYVSTQKLHPGKHLLKITTAVKDTTVEKGFLYALPFWYMPSGN